MVRFTITFLIMVVLFISGVLIGMNQASIGMIQMRGFTTETFEEAVQTSQTDVGNYEVKVLGKEFEQVSIDEKQQKYADHQDTGGLQKVALMLQSVVKWVYNTIIYTVYQLVQIFF